MPDEPKKIHVTLSFDIVEELGVDSMSILMQLDGKIVGFLDTINLSVKAKERWNKFMYTQFRNPRETGNVNDCGVWDIHTFGDKDEPND
jgi:hypothetical protein